MKNSIVSNDSPNSNLSHSLTLRQAYDLFLRSRKVYCEQTTVNNYTVTLKYFVEFMIEQKSNGGDFDVRLITQSDLDDYVIYLRSKDKCAGNPIYSYPVGTRLTKRTIRTYSIDVRTFFNWLFDSGYIQVNPAYGFKLIKSEKKSIIPINADQVHIIDDLFNVNTLLGSRNLEIVHCFLDAGLRNHEVVSLKVGDIHMENECIHIVQGKGSKDRVVPLARILKKYICRYLSFRSDVTAASHLFLNTAGDPITKECIKSLFYRIKAATGITPLYAHYLRHSFATAYLAGGGNLEMLRIYMGHSDIKTTEYYLHLLNTIQFCKNIYRLDPIFFRRLY